MHRPKRLWITEKPDAARNLVAGICSALNVRVTNQASVRSDNFHALSNGDVVVPLRGHMVEPVFLTREHKAANRAAYFDFLPIVVKKFTYQPKPDTDKAGKRRLRGDGAPIPPAQFKTACELIRSAGEIVNAGDVDREGQLIVDELLQHAGVDPECRDKPIWRLPLVSAREEDIRKQVLGLKEKNSDPKWVRRRLAALARQHYDAGLGFNASMAYQSVTDFARMSVGRVQTPIISLVVERDRAIDNFVPHNFFVPIVTLQDGAQLRFYRRDGAEGQPGFDEQGRIIDESIAQQMCRLIASGMPGSIKAASSINGSEQPPLPFSATVLASTVAKRTGMTPKDAERAAQSLYERHKAISYVGTDCKFLPTSLLEDARATLTALSRLYPKYASGASLDLRSRAWNDSKVDEHYAIVPTGKLPEAASPEEREVYDAVARRYMAQFYPAYQFVTHQLGAMFGKDEFRATRRETTRMGWKEVELNLEQGGPGSDGAGDEDPELQADIDQQHEVDR
jgi:DNA topoisomerase-3